MTYIFVVPCWEEDWSLTNMLNLSTISWGPRLRLADGYTHCPCNQIQSNQCFKKNKLLLVLNVKISQTKITFLLYTEKLFRCCIFCLMLEKLYYDWALTNMYLHLVSLDVVYTYGRNLSTDLRNSGGTVHAFKYIFIMYHEVKLIFERYIYMSDSEFFVVA